MTLLDCKNKVAQGFDARSWAELTARIRGLPHWHEVLEKHADKAAEMYANQYKMYPMNPTYKEVTGFDTNAERAAYDLGREHEAKTLLNWILNWNGKENSGMGIILMNKMKELSKNINDRNAEDE